jgi:hypothetical protein
MSDEAAGIASEVSSGAGAHAPMKAATNPDTMMVLEILD